MIYVLRGSSRSQRITINAVSLVQLKSKDKWYSPASHSSRLSRKYLIMLNWFVAKHKIQLPRIAHYLNIPIKYYIVFEEWESSKMDRSLALQDALGSSYVVPIPVLESAISPRAGSVFCPFPPTAVSSFNLCIASCFRFFFMGVCGSLRLWIISSLSSSCLWSVLLVPLLYLPFASLLFSISSPTLFIHSSVSVPSNYFSSLSEMD